MRGLSLRVKYGVRGVGKDTHRTKAVPATQLAGQ